MPAAYDATSRRFDDLMANACPGAREEVHARIDRLRADWKIREMAEAKQAPAIISENVIRR